MRSLSHLRFFALAGLLGLAACSSTPKDVDIERPVETSYNNAMDQLFSGDYKGAAKTFDDVEQP